LIVSVCEQNVAEASGVSLTSRLTSLEARSRQLLEMLARASTSLATYAALRRRLTRLERQLSVVVEQRKQLLMQ